MYIHTHTYIYNNECVNLMVGIFSKCMRVSNHHMQSEYVTISSVN